MKEARRLCIRVITPDGQYHQHLPESAHYPSLDFQVLEDGRVQVYAYRDIPGLRAKAGAPARKPERKSRVVASYPQGSEAAFIA